MSVTGTDISVQIRLLPDCPHTERVRELVRRVVAEAGVGIELKELVGAYPSPTVLVDGLDVTGEPLSERASCRLDLPTEIQLLTALRRATPGALTPLP